MCLFNLFIHANFNNISKVTVLFEAADYVFLEIIEIFTNFNVLTLSVIF